MTRHPLIAALAAALLILPAPLPAPAQTFELVAPQAERSVALVVGTGQLIRVDTEFSSLFVANPEVADIEVKSPRLMYLTGVGVGETTLFAVDENDTVLMSTRIKVTHNLEALRDGIGRVAPGQTVNVATVDQSLVLTGTVRNPDDATNILQVASQFVDDPTRVVNRMSISAPTQVNLQVRIAEVKRNVDRQLGIRWNNISLVDRQLADRLPRRLGHPRAAMTPPSGPRAATSASTWCCRRWPRRASSPSWPSRT